MKRRLLAVFAHPDDESFSSGGTLAKYVAKGFEVYLVAATKGEAGQWSGVPRRGRELGQVREKELLRAAKILGIKQVEFLGFIDGKISNDLVPKLTEAIVQKMREIKPQVVITFDSSGVSGHLDHIAVSLATARAFFSVEEVKKLYYVVFPRSWAQKFGRQFPGFPDDLITTKMRVSRYWPKKIEAVKSHVTQKADWERFFKRKTPKIENFYLIQSRIEHLKFPENDLFAGI